MVRGVGKMWLALLHFEAADLRSICRVICRPEKENTLGSMLLGELLRIVLTIATAAVLSEDVEM